MTESEFIDYFCGVLGFRDEHLIVAALCGYKYGYEAGLGGQDNIKLKSFSGVEVKEILEGGDA